MAYATPKQRSALQRPSYSTAGSSPNFAASTSINRKASLQALTGAATPNPKTPSSKMDSSDLEVGDPVNVPGDMYGIVKFIGNVRGKSGRFVGVELDRGFAARGKNDGDVDGISYFTTHIPGAGIFLPIHRAEKRLFPTLSSPASSPLGTDPDTPTYSTIHGHPPPKPTPPTPALPHRFAQTVGPGARPPSPTFKPKRGPSLPRPESPFRKPPPTLTPGRTLSQSTMGSSTRGGARPGLTPSKQQHSSNSNFKASVSSSMRPPTTTSAGNGHSPARPYSRSGSRLGRHDEESGVGSAITRDSNTAATFSASRNTSQGSVVHQSFSQPLRSPSRLGSAGQHETQQEVQRLKAQLQERDRRLQEQAASLAEMEQSVKELSAIIPQDNSTRRTTIVPASPDDEDGQTSTQLRQLLREKNEKISLLTAEFDAHRADFRSTLDSLEMASTETERVYEEQKRDLLSQLEVLQSQLQDANLGLAEQHSKEDIEAITTQLKQLEDLVAELEEGLEESRRGEAEARGEVEFLRGEVERGRSELKRERDKSAAAVGGGDGAGKKELEQKDDEIRGLKAIIHGLSSQPTTPSAGESVAPANGILANDGEVRELRTQLEESQREKEALEVEVERLRRDATMTNGAGHVRNESEMTAKAQPLSSNGTSSKRRPQDDSIRTKGATFAERMRNKTPDDLSQTMMANAAAGADSADNSDVYCEMCDSTEHDTLECTKIRNGGEEEDHDSTPYSPGKENESGMTNGHKKGFGENIGKAVGGEEQDLWCALCEKDGHLAFDCPEEQY